MLKEEFIKFLEREGFGVFGQTLFANRVPNSLKVNTDLYWVVSSGGDVIKKLPTGEVIKAYNISVFFRSKSSHKVDIELSKLEKLFNCLDCVAIQNYQVISTSASQFNPTLDLDTEDTMYGSVEVQLVVYNKCI